MIWKAGATMGAFIPLAAAALAKGGDGTVRPDGTTVWHFLGNPFEAGSMIAGICACIAVRLYVSQKDRAEHRWNIDLPVSALALMITAGAVMRLRPDPALALIYGTGIGAMGVSLITLAMNFVQSRIPGAEDKQSG